MKRYVVEIVEKVVYKVEFSANSQEYAERRVREIYDSGALEGIGELETVSFDVEEKEGRNERNQFQGNTSKNRCVG